MMYSRSSPGPRRVGFSYPVSIALICLGLVLGAVLSYLYLPGTAAPTPAIPLSVGGDVATPLRIRGLDPQDYTVDGIRAGERGFRATPLAELLARAGPWSEDFRALFVVDDGTKVAIPADELSGLNVGHDDAGLWALIDTRNRPVVTIPDLREMAVVSTGDPGGRGLAILDRDANLVESSPGALFERGFRVRPLPTEDCPRDTAGDAIPRTGTARRVRTIALEDWIGTAPGEEAVVVGRDGSIHRSSGVGHFLLEENRVSYCAGDGEAAFPVRGVILDPPERRITDVFFDARDALGRGDRVLIVLLDGLGYHQFFRAAGAGRTPFLGSLAEPDIALATYPPITPVNFAAAITGADPSETGIRDRDTRRSLRPSIFAVAGEMGHRSTLVTGSISPLDLEIDPVMNVDRNEDGSTDDEVFGAAMDRIDSGYALLMVHLKDVDRAGHSFGPDAPETLDAIERLDGYLHQLVSAWNGPVIVFSDHGMHEIPEGGYHGAFRVEDMMIPYWIIDGGIQHE